MNGKRASKPLATMVYVHERVKRRLKRALLDLEDVAYHGKRPDQSSVTAALWHWFAQLSPAEAEAFLLREFPRLEESIGAIPGAPEPEPDVPGHDPISPPRKRKGRSG